MNPLAQTRKTGKTISYKFRKHKLQTNNKNIYPIYSDLQIIGHIHLFCISLVERWRHARKNKQASKWKLLRLENF